MQKEKINPHLISVITVGVCAALLTVCSWISIPAFGPFVPFTLQTFAVFLIAGLFPFKESILTVVIYIALGMAGVPVFSGFKSGIAAVTGPTGGYIVGFLLAVVIISLFKRLKPGSILFLIIGMIAGLAVCYAFGTGWFYFVFLNTEKQKGILEILSICVFPFLIPDAVKMAVAVLLVNRLSLPLTKLGFADKRNLKPAASQS